MSALEFSQIQNKTWPVGPLSSTHIPESSKGYSPIHSFSGKLPNIKGEAGVMTPF